MRFYIRKPKFSVEASSEYIISPDGLNVSALRMAIGVQSNEADRLW